MFDRQNSTPFYAGKPVNLTKRIAESGYVRAALEDRADLILTFSLNFILIFAFGDSRTSLLIPNVCGAGPVSQNHHFHFVYDPLAF